MPQSLDIWSVFIIISLAHSLFVVSLLVPKINRRNLEKLYFLLILLFLVWIQLEFLSVRWPFSISFPSFYGTRYGAWLAMGPLLYAYVRQIAGNPLKKVEYFYFLPLVLFVFVVPLFDGVTLSYRQVHYGMLTPFDSRPDQLTIVQYVFAGVFIFQFLYCGIFIIKGAANLTQYKNDLQEEYASVAAGSIRLVAWVLLGVAIIMVVVSLFIGFLFFSDLYRRDMDYFYVLPVTSWVYAISYKLATVHWVKPQLQKYGKSRLQEEDKERIKRLIISDLREKKLFLNKELRMSDLVQSTGVATHHLSEVLNDFMGTSFYQLINKYRVEEAKLSMQQKPHLKLLQIGLDAGFNNKTSFVNAFKASEGQTPSAYFKSIK